MAWLNELPWFIPAMAFQRPVRHRSPKALGSFMQTILFIAAHVYNKTHNSMYEHIQLKTRTSRLADKSSLLL